MMTDAFAQSTASPPLRLEQRGRASELTPIVLLNALLNIITLSFYRFWGRTNVRRFIWRNTYFMDEPLEYTGTGGELFKGFLVVLFLIILPLIVVNTAAELYFGTESPGHLTISGLTYFGILFLVGVAVYRARRYRLSRTVWRGIRGGMSGSSLHYAWRTLFFWFLTALTLGWAYPWMRRKLFTRIMNETTFGDQNFRCQTELAPLYRAFALVWVFIAVMVSVIGVLLWQMMPDDFVAEQPQEIEFQTLPVIMIVALYLVIGIGIAFYRAREINLFAKGTSFQGLSFDARVTAGGLIVLMLINFLIVALTLGFGLPYTQLRVFRFICDRLQIHGELNPAWIAQSSAETPSMGEGLADAFDLGAV